MPLHDNPPPPAEIPEPLFLGWDVGGTKSAAVVGTGGGRIVERKSWPSEAHRGFAAMFGDFLEQALPLARRFPAISALGVSIGGPLDPNRGVVLSPPHLPGWDNIPLRDLLSARFSLPVTVEHDAVACLLAEHLWGAAQHCTHALYLTAGTGFGAGILVDGRVLRGPSGQTTEIGHVRLAEEGPLVFGKAGCAESFCSGTGIALLAHEMFPGHFPQPTPVADLARQAQTGDAKAREVLLAAARWTGRVCAMLSSIVSPEAIVIGSLARYLPPWWLEAIREEFSREILPQNGAHTRIVPSALGERLQDLSTVAPCVFHRQR